MKPVLILCAVVVFVQGRPEAPSGYNYQAPPSARYGAPTGGQGAGFPSGQASAGSGFGGGSAGSSTGSFGSGSGSGFGGSFGSAQATSSSQSGASTSGSSSSNGADSGTIVINKHVYVHVAPPELEEEPQQKAQVRVPPPQKNYKIIFIKAPAPAATQAPEIPPIPQNEEKTLVYVLVKKPEEQAEIEIPTAAPTEPSRPEVYFIRYKTQKEGGQQGATGGDDFSDTVEVGARQGGAAGGQGGAVGGQGGAAGGQGGAAGGQGGFGGAQGGFGGAQGSLGGAGAGGSQGDAAGRQGGASAGGYSYSSSRSSSAAVSRQYGAPSSSGPY